MFVADCENCDIKISLLKLLSRFIYRYTLVAPSITIKYIMDIYIPNKNQHQTIRIQQQTGQTFFFVYDRRLIVCLDVDSTN